RRSSGAWRRRSLAFLPRSSLTDLRYRSDNPRNVLRTRQAMVAILDHGQHHVIGRKPVHQGEGVLPWHIRIFRALQDADGASGLDGAAKQQMLAAFLD